MVIPDLPVQLLSRYAAAGFVTYWLLVFSYRLLFHPLRKYPGPLLARLTDAYGGWYSVKGCLHLLTIRNHDKYGSVFRQGPNRLLFNSAQALHDIYDNEKVIKSDVYLTTLGTSGTISVWSSLDKHSHRPRRRLIGSILNDRAMRSFEPTMAVEIDTFIRQILRTSQSHDNNNVEVSERARDLAVDIVGHLSFGYPLMVQTEETNRFFQKGISDSGVHNNTLMQFPWLANWLFNVLVQVVIASTIERTMALTRKMISVRMKQDIDANQDFYSHVAGKLDKDLDMMKNGMWAEALFLIAAGSDTTSTAIAATFFYLTQTPHAYQKVAQEIRSTFTTGQDIHSGPSLFSCKYLRACIDEAMRLAPPVTGGLWRQQDPNDDDKENPLIVDGHVVPPGTHIAVNIYSLHHNPEYFPDPYSFKPERWLDDSNTNSNDDDNERRQAMNRAFAAFSIGSRGCAGKTMAYLEISLALAKAFFYFDFERAPGEKGRVGEGAVGGPLGRERTDEFQLRDTLSSAHDGPNLIFTPRGDYWKNLVE